MAVSSGSAWLLGAGVLLTAAAFVTGFLSALQWWLVPLVLVASVAVNTALWLWTSWVLPNRKAPLRPRIPAAIFGAVGLEALKIAGVYIVPLLVSKSSALYGTIGVVFAFDRVAVALRAPRGVRDDPRDDSRVGGAPPTRKPSPERT